MSIFAIGMSGLNAAQQGLQAASNNVSNVNTPGYTREVVQFGENRNGNGVRTLGVERQFNQFINSQLDSAKSSYASLETYESQINQIDNLLSDDSAGLAPMMQQFFSSLGEMASSPADPAARNGVLGAASTMAAQFRSYDEYLQGMQSSLNDQIQAEVENINAMTGQIAELNREITLAQTGGTNAPNTLLNERDRLISELNESVDVRVSQQDSGFYNISTANGQSLVSGSQAQELVAHEDPADPTRTTVGYRDSAGNLQSMPEESIEQGALGGMLAFRNEALDRVQGQLGQLAVSLGHAFNEQHQAGITLAGEAGGDLFELGEPRSFSHSENTSEASLTPAVTDAEALQPSKYAVRFDGDSYQVTQLNNGQSVEANFNPTDATLSFGGMTVGIEGEPAAGDQFQVQPVHGVLNDFDVAIDDVTDLAAGQSNATGDNQNALALQDLQEQGVVGGNATFSQAYSSIVGDTGTRIRVVQTNLNAQEGLRDQLEQLQQAESGVNLDEEAANLMRFQQYYQANARVIEAGSMMLDTLLSIRG